ARRRGGPGPPPRPPGGPPLKERVKTAPPHRRRETRSPGGGGPPAAPPPGPAGLSYTFRFRMSQSNFDELRIRLAEIADLVKTASLLSWDQHVMMPPRGAQIRAEQLATVGRIAHQKFISAEIGTLIDGLRDWGE